MRRRTVLGAAGALAGCSVLPQQPYLQRRDWPLVVRRPQALPPRRGGPVLLVRTVSAGPGLGVRGLQRLLPDGSLMVDFYEQWAVPPAQGVEECLWQWLAESGLFAAVTRSGSRLTADYVLEGDLTTFVADPPQRVARTALSIILLNQISGADRLVLQKAESAEAPLASADASAIVQSLKAALTTVLEATEADIAQALAHGGRSSRS